MLQTVALNSSDSWPVTTVVHLQKREKKKKRRRRFRDRTSYAKHRSGFVVAFPTPRFFFTISILQAFKIGKSPKGYWKCVEQLLLPEILQGSHPRPQGRKVPREIRLVSMIIKLQTQILSFETKRGVGRNDLFSPPSVVLSYGAVAFNP